MAFGYASTLYDNAEAAEAVNSGQTLVPWKDNAELTVDRSAAV